MWSRAHSSGDLTTEVLRSQQQQGSHGFSSNKEAVQSVFNSTRCYDLMQNSCKAVVFETHIPFQLAFYALVEHDTDIAPLWDPQKRAFVAMMTMTDFISALRAYRRNGIPVSELSNSLIADMLENTNFKFRHDTFETVDAEETVYQMCRLLQRQGTDFVPVVDPDEGNLVAILGYLDIVNLLYTASLQFTHLFETTVEESKVGTYQVITAPKNALLSDVLNVLDEKSISSIPITDEENKVIGLCYKSDVTFITKASDPDSVMNNLSSLLVGDIVSIQQQQQRSGEALSTSQASLCKCRMGDSIKSLLTTMMTARVSRVVLVDDMDRCLGIISIKDIVWYYFDSSTP